MKEKILKKIVADIAGQEAEKLVDLLYNKKNVNEFLIAKKLSATINQTRNILYKLADNGLVRFVRKKDKKKGGWYTYFWTFNTEKSLSKYQETLDSEIKKMKEKLENLEKEKHFFCKNCEINYSEENALINEYTCPECGETLEIGDTKLMINKINDEIKKLHHNLHLVDGYIREIQERGDKLKQRRLKVEIKKKKEDREKKRKERIKEKEKEKKKSAGAKKKKPGKAIKRKNKIKKKKVKQNQKRKKRK